MGSGKGRGETAAFHHHRDDITRPKTELSIAAIEELEKRECSAARLPWSASAAPRVVMSAMPAALWLNRRGRCALPLLRDHGESSREFPHLLRVLRGEIGPLTRILGQVIE